MVVSLLDDEVSIARAEFDITATILLDSEMANSQLNEGTEACQDGEADGHPIYRTQKFREVMFPSSDGENENDVGRGNDSDSKEDED
jgi:hypothetical protein